jgi:hypothetical protein
MKNNIYNRITSPAVTPDMTGEAQKAIKSVSGIFPFMVTLTAEERKALQGIDVGNKAFSEDALQVARSNEAILPPYHSVERFGNQMDAFEAMDVLIQKVEELYNLLRDTRLAMGAAAYQTALSLYHYFDQARKDGVVGAEAAYQLLSARFKGQGNFHKKDGEGGK